MYIDNIFLLVVLLWTFTFQERRLVFDDGQQDAFYVGAKLSIVFLLLPQSGPNLEIRSNSLNIEIIKFVPPKTCPTAIKKNLDCSLVRLERLRAFLWTWTS